MGEAIKGKGIGEILGWHGIDAPWVTVTPDLILASDNYRKIGRRRPVASFFRGDE